MRFRCVLSPFCQAKAAIIYFAYLSEMCLNFVHYSLVFLIIPPFVEENFLSFLRISLLDKCRHHVVIWSNYSNIFVY